MLRRSPLLQSENFSRLSAVQQGQLVDAFLQKSIIEEDNISTRGGNFWCWALSVIFIVSLSLCLCVYLSVCLSVSHSLPAPAPVSEPSRNRRVGAFETTAAATFDRAECFRLVMKPCADAGRWELMEKLLRAYVQESSRHSDGSRASVPAATTAAAATVPRNKRIPGGNPPSLKGYAHVVQSAIQFYARDGNQLNRALSLLQSVTASQPSASASAHPPPPSSWKPLTPTSRLVLPILDSLLAEATAARDHRAPTSTFATTATANTANTTSNTRSTADERIQSKVPPALVMWTVLTHCTPLGYEASPAVLMRVLRAIAATTTTTTTTTSPTTSTTMEKLASAERRILGMLLKNPSGSPPPPSGVYAHLVRRCRSHESMLQIWNRSRKVGHWRTVFANETVQQAFLETALSTNLSSWGASSSPYAGSSSFDAGSSPHASSSMYRSFHTPSSRAWYWLHQWQRHDFPITVATYQRMGLLLADASVRNGRLTSDFQSVLNLLDQQPQMLDFRFTTKLLSGISRWRRGRESDRSSMSANATATTTTTTTTTTTVDCDDMHQRRKLMHRVLQQCLQHENQREGGKKAIPRYFPISLVRAFGRVGDVQMCWQLWPLASATPHGQRVFYRALQQQQPGRSSGPAASDMVQLLQQLPADSPLIPDTLLSLLDRIQTKRELLAPSYADTSQPLLQGRPYYPWSPYMLYNVLHASVDWHLNQPDRGGGGVDGSSSATSGHSRGDVDAMDGPPAAPLADPQQWTESLEQSLVALVQRLRQNDTGRTLTGTTSTTTTTESARLPANDPAMAVITRAVEELDSLVGTRRFD